MQDAIVNVERRARDALQASCDPHSETRETRPAGPGRPTRPTHNTMRNGSSGWHPVARRPLRGGDHAAAAPRSVPAVVSFVSAYAPPRTFRIERTVRARQTGVAQRRRQPVARVRRGWRRAAVHRAGARIRDVDRRTYIDYVMSWGPLIHGHAPAGLTRALRSAAGRGTSFGAPTAQETELGRLVCRLIPSVERVRFVRPDGRPLMAPAVPSDNAPCGWSHAARRRLPACPRRRWRRRPSRPPVRGRQSSRRRR